MNSPNDNSIPPIRLSDPGRHLRIAFVVQRCGLEVNGGAETLCLQLAQRMAAYWHTEVLTTCALDYMTWENSYPEGLEQLGATSVRRFPVDHPRDVAAFDRLSEELRARQAETSLSEQENWMQAQGPISSALLDYLRSNESSYDAFIFFGYLYATTYFGLPLVDNAWLAPLAHDEWPIYFTMWDSFFQLPKGLIFQTPEERAFFGRRFPSLSLKGPVAGVGIDLPATLDPSTFRRKYELRRPFLLYVGRIDASKGCAGLFDWFRQRGDGVRNFQLVLTGREILPVPYDPDIIYLGFVSEEDKWNAMASCHWLILPSEYESLSISLLETWAAGRPGIVNAKSEVLLGHCQRSNGGVWYSDWAECEALLELIDAETASTLGRQGQAYVRERYAWERVEHDFLDLLEPQMR